MIYSSSLSRLSSAIGLAFVIAGCAAAPKPPFDWIPGYSDPGCTLVAIPDDDAPPIPGPLAAYTFKATGFQGAQNLTLWWNVGPEYVPTPVTLSEEGVVQFKDGEWGAVIGGSHPGAVPMLDMTLADNLGRRAHVQATPFGRVGKYTGLEPPFEWALEYADPETSLKIEQGPLAKTDDGTLVTWRAKPSGFSSDEELVLWRKSPRGFERHRVRIDRSGFLEDANPSPYTVTNAITEVGYVPGMPYEIALVGKTSGKRAHATKIPFPLETTGASGIHISANYRGAMGTMFVMMITGFEQGEVKLITERNGKKREVTNNLVRSEKSEPKDNKYAFAVWHRGVPEGKAKFTVIAPNGTATLEYGVGKDALIVQ